MLFAFIGTSEIVIVLAIALLVFGPSKLPEIGRQIGSAMREMRKMSSEVQRALDLDDYAGGYDRRHDPVAYPGDAGAPAAWGAEDPDRYPDTDEASGAPHGGVAEPDALAGAAGAPSSAAAYPAEGVPGTVPAARGLGTGAVEPVTAAATTTLVEPPGPPAVTQEKEQ